MSENNAGETMGGFILEVVKMFVLALIIIVPIRVFLFQPFIVRGASMEPNFHEKQYLIINEFGYKNVDVLGAFTIEPRKFLERGDIAVFKEPLKKKDFYIKRIIGEPGETVQLKNSVITIFNEENPDGFDLDESTYLPNGRRTTGDELVTLEEDEYFVLGDNRGASSDSRAFGPVERDVVVGRVFLRAFPFTKIDVY